MEAIACSLSLQLLGDHRGLRCAPFKESVVRNTRSDGARYNNLCSRRKFASSAFHNFDLKVTFSRLSYDYRRQSRDSLSRNNIVRSEIAGTGSPPAAYPISDLQLVSKVRGAGFYAVTSAAALILFVLMVVGHPLVFLMDRYCRKFHHLIAKTWATLTVTPFLKIKYEGLDNLPPSDTPAVYVSNHQSFLDIYTLLTLGRSFKFISKTAIFLFPVVGWAMFLMGVIRLKRVDTRSQLQALKCCTELVKNGGSVFFFPEGTRSKGGKLGDFKRDYLSGTEGVLFSWKIHMKTEKGSFDKGLGCFVENYTREDDIQEDMPKPPPSHYLCLPYERRSSVPLFVYHCVPQVIQWL